MVSRHAHNVEVGGSIPSVATKFLPQNNLLYNMTPEEKKKTANVLMEKSVWVRIGWLFIKIKPLTLGQIYEMGEFTCQMEDKGLELNQRVMVVAEMLLRYKNAKWMQEVFLVAAFRKQWKRRLFRKYILNRLTMSIFEKAMEVITNAFTANFFLTSIIFLRQTNQISEPNSTTAHGQQSEE